MDLLQMTYVVPSGNDFLHTFLSSRFEQSTDAKDPSTDFNKFFTDTISVSLPLFENKINKLVLVAIAFLRSFGVSISIIVTTVLITLKILGSQRKQIFSLNTPKAVNGKKLPNFSQPSVARKTFIAPKFIKLIKISTYDLILNFQSSTVLMFDDACLYYLIPLPKAL
ncbi:CLUMA_CG017218, isoform A [Clunio marinus]|uniref:CLUMA_CG017218, isoform A n=1 Tax=Clunio marinus TaxID=568069 RepID=A0A1J1IZU3_9DIPT|nr:CLUMA_CG017218, isoform A [Clunio marinus]